MSNFCQAHPAVAEEHYKRTPEQNKAIEVSGSILSPKTRRSCCPSNMSMTSIMALLIMGC
eukprot:scaffold35022_cov20-Prasinocladus_malaysianus.AAC.1